MSLFHVKNTVAAGTSLLTVVAPKFCCWSTALAAFSGGTSYLAWVYPMRPYLFAFSFLLVGISIYQTYKKNDSETGTCQTCEQNTWWNKYSKYLTWGIALFILITFLLSYSK